MSTSSYRRTGGPAAHDTETQAQPLGGLSCNISKQVDPPCVRDESTQHVGD